MEIAFFSILIPVLVVPFFFPQPQTSKRPGQRQRAAYRSHGAEGRQEGGLEAARTPRVDYLASPACFT